MMVSIVRLTPPDAGLLSKIGAMTLLESHGHSAPPLVMQEYVDKSFSTEACLAELEDEHNNFHAIYYKEQPAGYSKIVFNYSHPAVALQPVTKMERLYLLKEFYELRLGRELMEHAIDLSKAAADLGMWLNVWKENRRAVSFYQKQGFETVGESEFILTATHANPNWVMLLKYQMD